MNRMAALAEIRFGLGLTPGQPGETDPKSALKAQLQGSDPALASNTFANLPRGVDGIDALRDDAVTRKAMLASGTPLKGNFKPKSRQMFEADVAAQMGWATTTTASFRERLVWFWTNHFTVSIYQNQTAALVGPMIREAIRPYVTGNFTDMVLAVERHPAMLRYLANDASFGPNSRAGLRTHRGLNENLGRECMELHTVGLKAGYSQADVTSMANILTGWSTAPSSQTGDPTGFIYRPFAHEPGAQTVMGQTYTGGEEAGIAALTYLSKYPTTYDLIAGKLATHFISDNPAPLDIAHLAGILRETGGDLGAVSAALVDLPAAWQPLTKLKTPLEYIVSTIRAAPPPPKQPPVNYVGVAAQLGQPIWGAPLPNGWPDVAANWDGSDALLARINWAFGYSGRFEAGADGVQPADIAASSLGPLLKPATNNAMALAGSRREAVTLLFASPEFQRR
ncbi:MAG: DUF1800 domain-containing protein [Acidocella sp.]|nr:DUF1800 domain-containing protein [Acidocella sp.]